MKHRGDIKASGLHDASACQSIKLGGWISARVTSIRRSGYLALDTTGTQ